MSKKAIAWIVALMSLSLIGLIVFQAYWIWLSAEQKAEEFDRDVLQALELAKEKIERQEVKVFLSNLSNTATDSSGNNIKWNQNDMFEVVTNQEIKIEDKGSVLESVKKELRFLKDSNVNGGMVLISDEIKGVSTNAKGDSNKQKVTMIKRFQKRKNELSEVVEELAFEFAFKESSLKDRLKNIKVDSLLSSSFSALGMGNLDYKYALINSTNDSLLSGKDLKGQQVEQLFEQKVFSSPRQSGTINLIVNNKKAYVLKSLWVMILISTTLTFIMLGTFSFTIYAILRQKKISDVKSDFINNMTHEFKTPIATISLAIDSILHPQVKKDEKEIDRFGAIIKKENQRMNHQVERVLQMAMFEKQEIELEKQNIDVHALLNELTEAFLLATKTENSQLDLNLNAKKHTVIADSMHLYNAFRNIIDNAIKFSQKPFTVLISTTNSIDNIEITISDHGIGMSANTQKRIFDRFYRLSQGNLHQTKGFGLGLAYVKEVIEKMQGTIEVDSKLGKGSTFKITLPLAK